MVATALMSSNCYAGHEMSTNIPSQDECNRLENNTECLRACVEMAYAGNHYFILRHDERAFVYGLLSLIPTIYSGYHIGGILGNSIATGLATVTRDENLSKNFVTHSFKLGAGLGIVAGISMSHKFYQYLYDKWTKAADERVKDVVVNSIQKDELKSMHTLLTANAYTNCHLIYYTKTYTFQGNPDSYNKFLDILNPNVAQSE
jgi:hypothetical protein